MMCLGQLAKNTRGAAAVEFAFLAPVLILLYFGMVEYCQGYMALKRTGHVASMVADLVSQNDTVTKTQITDIFAIGDQIIRPFSNTPPDAEGQQRHPRRYDHLQGSIGA